MSLQSNELIEGASAEADRAVVNGAASASAVPASIPSAVEDLASTLEWCAKRGRIEGLHPAKVNKAAALLREQAQQIVDMAATIAANTPTVLFDEREGFSPYTIARRFTFIAVKPQAYQVETQTEAYLGYPVEVEARRAVSMFVRQFEEAMLPLAAQAIEAGTGETRSRLDGDSHESAVP